MGGAVRGRRRVGQPARIGEAVSTFRRKLVSRPENADETEPNRGGWLGKVARRREPGGGEGHAQDAAGVAQRGRLIGAGGGPPLPPHGGILRWWSGGGRARRGGFGALRLASGKSGTLASRFKATSAKRRSKTPQVQTRGARREARGAAAGTHRASARRVGARGAHVLAPATPRERGASTRKRRARASGSVSLTSTCSRRWACANRRRRARRGPAWTSRYASDIGLAETENHNLSASKWTSRRRRRDAYENTRNRAPLDARATTTRGAPLDRALDLSWVSDDDARKRRATTLDDGRGILPPAPRGARRHRRRGRRAPRRGDFSRGRPRRARGRRARALGAPGHQLPPRGRS